MYEFKTIDGPVPVLALIDERLSTTTVCLASKYGSRDDPPGECGLAHVLEHVLMSAPVGAVPSFSEHVERLGGHANAETGLDRMLFYAQVHADDAGEITGLLHHAVLRPRWDQETLSREKPAVLQELSAAAADPSDVVQDAFLAHVFPDHPLGRPVGGLREDVERFDVGSLAEGHARRLLTAPLSLIVVGPSVPASADPVTAGIDPRTLTRLGTATRDPHALPALPAPEGARWPDTFAWVCVGARSVGNHDPRRPHFNVLAQLLGSSPSSVLYRRLRGEAGLAYAFQSWNRGYGETGAWRVLAGVEPGNGEAAIDVIRTALEEIAAEGPGPDDLAAARRQAQMRILTSVDTPLECARFLAMRSGGPAGWSPAAEVDALAGVNAGDLREAARHVLRGLRAVVRPEAR
ncbi:pitrilysin family protein [Streptomyces sp. TG1A-8]|uniref:M16 family metallopeptidase n=1 Tax=Streptomyces sp. TG1A-8 TaxID=3051385 RepID=UPI00265B7457|nr:pitrilysin family protein [Streptomyces sp. TG1A-8]MDO0925031.1 pitrilysin family protein [Streptomyces sp. TG1A-8]